MAVTLVQSAFNHANSSPISLSQSRSDGGKPALGSLIGVEGCLFRIHQGQRWVYAHRGV